MKYLKRAQTRPMDTCSEQRKKNVEDIINRVRQNGDEALIEYNTRFDGNGRKNLRISREEIDSAYALMSFQELNDIKQAAENIRAFAEAQRNSFTELENFSSIPGSSLGHRIIPVSSCGCYVPGGSYPLFSTALMLIIPAKLAGVKRIVACSPAAKGTEQINYKTLVAMDIAGADEIYAVGGAQSIAALTYGTEQIKPVDLITGPGNQYVSEAKRQCYGKVGIDFFAGPSEVLALADSSADADILAADMLAQSEHDRQAKAVLLTTNQALGEAVIKAIQAQLAVLPTSATASVSWENNGEVLLAESMDEAVEIANDYAPEHLELIVRDESIIPKLVNFGSMFLEQATGEVFGDYASGTNHTLPTDGAARYTGGVWVGTYLKVCTVQRFDKNAMAAIAPLVKRMAQSEGLAAHAEAAEIRMKKAKLI